MKTITFSNEKGGVGKTTLAIHTAAGLAVRGKRVLLIDADAQANATEALGIAPQAGIYDLMVRSKPWKEVLHVMPPETYEPPNVRSKGLLAVLPGDIQTGVIGQLVQDVFLLSTRLKEIENSIDVVVIDTAPTPSLLHGVIYLATDAIVFPTLCETFSLRGIVKTIANLDRFSNQREMQLGTRITPIGIIPNMYRGKTVEHTENLQALRDQFGGMVWDPIRQGIIWSESTNMMRPVFTLEPTSIAAREAWDIVSRVEGALNVIQEATS
jgi:chromosome partitioning protein